MSVHEEGGVPSVPQPSITRDSSSNEIVNPVQMPFPVRIKLEPLDSVECFETTTHNNNIQVVVKQEIKEEPLDKSKVVNPLADGVIIPTPKQLQQQKTLKEKRKEKKIKRAMKKALLVLKQEQDGTLNQENSLKHERQTLTPQSNKKWLKNFDPTRRRNPNRVNFLEMLDLPVEVTYDDIWNLLKDCNSSQILKLTIENDTQSKKIVKVYFTSKKASKTAMRQLQGVTVFGAALRMRTRTLSEKNSRVVTAEGPLTTYTLRAGAGHGQGQPSRLATFASNFSAVDITKDSDSEVEILEPRAKRPKKTPPPWRPDIDMYAPDPSGLYGLKPEFLELLNIKPPITPWVLVTGFRCGRLELKEVMDLAGEVLICNLVQYRTKIANVMYNHPLEAVQAVSMLNNQIFYGQPLNVQIDSNPPEKCLLPNGLSDVGPGLGIYGKPLRDLVRHYKRYVKNQSSLINKIAFKPLDLILPIEVSDSEEKQDNQSKNAETVSAPNQQETENDNAQENFAETISEDAENQQETENHNLTEKQSNAVLEDDPEQQETENYNDENNDTTDQPNISDDFADNDQTMENQDDRETNEYDQDMDTSISPIVDNEQNTEDNANDNDNSQDARSDMDVGSSQSSQSDAAEEAAGSPRQSQESDSPIEEVENDATSNQSIETLDTSSGSSDDSDSSESDLETDCLSSNIVTLTKEIENSGSPGSFVGGGSMNKSNSTPNLTNIPGFTGIQNLARETRGMTQGGFRFNNSGQSQFRVSSLFTNNAQYRPPGPQNSPGFVPSNRPKYVPTPLNACPSLPRNGAGFNVGGPRMPGPGGPIVRPGPVGPIVRPGPVGQMGGPMRMPVSSPRAQMPGPTRMGSPNFPQNRPMNMPGPVGGSMRMPGPNVSPVAAKSGGTRTTVQLRNLPLSTTFPFLCDKMTECGQVISVQFTTPGCALVQFAQFIHARACWQLYNNKVIQGNVVTATLV